MLTFLPHQRAQPAPANPHDDEPAFGPRTSRRHPGRGATVAWTMPTRIAERRARMREVGAGLFAREGVNGVAVLDVARAADAPVSASAHGYRRRQDLLFDILHAYVDALHEYAGDADEAHQADPPERRMVEVIAALLEGLDDHRDAHELMKPVFPTLADDQREALRYLTRTLIYRLAPILDQAVPGIGQRHDLRSPLLQSLLGMTSHAPAWFREGGPLSRRDYAALVSRVIIEGGRMALVSGVMPAAKRPDMESECRDGHGRAAD